MNIPKELVGKVEKFEDLSFSSLLPKRHEQFWVDVDNKREEVKSFYRQPFTPEMIEKYFEGWRYHPRKNTYRKSSTEIRVDAKSIEFDVSDYSEDWQRISTLSDFIDACKNSEIELTWRQT